MNCNDTLDALLCEGFSTSLELEEHLSRCPRCRSLVVAISPMIESDHDSSSLTSPSFTGFQDSSPAALSIATSTANRLNHKPVPQKPAERLSLKRLRYVAAFLAGVAASLGCLSVIRSEPIQPSPSLATACLWESDFDSQQSESGLADRKLAEENLVRSCVACHLIAQR